MFNFDKFRQTAVAAIASIILTATMVSAAVGPVHAIAATPAASVEA